MRNSLIPVLPDCARPAPEALLLELCRSLVRVAAPVALAAAGVIGSGGGVAVFLKPRQVYGESVSGFLRAVDKGWVTAGC